MPPTAETEEPLTLAQAAKAHFQPAKPAREVTHEPAEPAAPKEQAPPTKESVPKAPANEPPAKVDPPAAAAPANEDAAVFGDTPPAKSKNPNDEDFEAKLTEEKKGMTDKAGAKWEQLRRSEKAAKDEARQAREELKTAAEARQQDKQPEDAPKLEAANAKIADLELQLAEAEKTLSVTQVERSQKFRREVGEPLSELTKQAEDIAGRYDVAAKVVLEALQADPKDRADRLAEVATDFKEGDRIELYAIAKDMDRLRRAGDKLREKAKTDLSALEEEDREAEERTTAEIRQTFSAAAQRVWDEATKTFDFLRPNAAAPEWTAALANARAQSNGYIPGQDAITDGKMIAEAHVAPFLRKALDHKTKVLATITEERDRLLERIAADGAHDPGLGGARDDDAPEGGGEDDDLTIGQRAKRAAAGMK